VLQFLARKAAVNYERPLIPMLIHVLAKWRKPALGFLVGLFAITHEVGTAAGGRPLAAPKDELVITEPASGLTLMAVKESPSPRMRLLVPDDSGATGEILVEFPEHAWGRVRKTNEVERLYINTPDDEPRTKLVTQFFFFGWHQGRNSLYYEMDLKNKVRMRAEATLEPDGVRYRYTFTNHSSTEYDELQAVTDPRLHGIFHDKFLRRTYVHRNGEFELLASDTPQRLKMTEAQWLPCRYLDSYEWPAPPPDKRIEKREGITYYNASRPVDEPLIATVSKDGRWIVATFTCHTGNVWSNPELTCQHADPSIDLSPGETKRVELKTFVFRGSLMQLSAKIRAERRSCTPTAP
jgi:hypothetical protein